MKLNELLEPGDVINTHLDAHYVVRGGGEVYNRATGCTTDVSNFNYNTIPSYIRSIVRGTEDITSMIKEELAPRFKFGDRVVNDVTPESEAVFIKYTEHPYCDVAYKDTNETVVQSTHVGSIRHAN